MTVGARWASAPLFGPCRGVVHKEIGVFLARTSLFAPYLAGCVGLSNGMARALPDRLIPGPNFEVAWKQLGC